MAEQSKAGLVWWKCTNVGDGSCSALMNFSENFNHQPSTYFWVLKVCNLSRCDWPLTNTAKSHGHDLNIIIPLSYISAAVPVKAQIPLWKWPTAGHEGRCKNRTGDTSYSYILPGILTQGLPEPEVVSLHLKGLQRFFLLMSLIINRIFQSIQVQEHLSYRICKQRHNSVSFCLNTHLLFSSIWLNDL